MGVWCVGGEGEGWECGVWEGRVRGGSVVCGRGGSEG